MPILIWHYCDESAERSIFLGVCEFHKRDEFEEKIKKLCEALEWDFKAVHTQHGYANSLSRNLNYL